MGIISKSKHALKYPDLPFAMRPVPHSEEFHVPKPPENLILMKITDNKQGASVDCDLTVEASCSSSEPHLLT
jgi:hypothetical protein